jgi:hypothetical protein
MAPAPVHWAENSIPESLAPFDWDAKLAQTFLNAAARSQPPSADEL